MYLYLSIIIRHVEMLSVWPCQRFSSLGRNSFMQPRTVLLKFNVNILCFQLLLITLTIMIRYCQVLKIIKMFSLAV